MTKNRVYRVTFEFEDEAQANQFLDHIGNAIQSGSLTINGSWSWAAECAEAITFIEQENDNDDDN